MTSMVAMAWSFAAVEASCAMRVHQIADAEHARTHTRGLANKRGESKAITWLDGHACSLAEEQLSQFPASAGAYCVLGCAAADWLLLSGCWGVRRAQVLHDVPGVPVRARAGGHGGQPHAGRAGWSGRPAVAIQGALTAPHPPPPSPPLSLPTRFLCAPPRP